MNPHTSIPRRQRLLILAVLAIGLILAVLIWRMDGASDTHDDEHQHGAAENSATLPEDQHQHAQAAPELPRGPHGGKLFSQDGYAVEVTIFEQNVAPQLRLYTYQDGQALDPAQSDIVVTLQRLGRPAQTIRFSREEDYLKGDQVIEEPHSFQVAIQAERQGKRYRFGYEQVEARVPMSERQLQLNAIEVLTAAPANIKSQLKLMGEIRANADRTVYIVPRLGGIVESVAVNAGDSVQRGQLLAVVSSQALADQRSELMAAQKRQALAQLTYQREKQLWEERISAEQDYQQARQALQEAEIAVQGARQKLAAIGGRLGSGNDLTRYEIRSPIAGTVTDKQVAAGQVVGADANILVISDLSTVWAEITVYAKDLNTVRVGQQVTVRASAFDAQAQGQVSYLGALVGTQSRTTNARVMLPNAQGIWRPGLPVNVELVAEQVEVPLAVSLEGLQTLGEQQVVFGRYGEQFEARPLRLGRSDGHYAEVLSGLLPGERYAARNSFLVKADLGKAGASHDH